MHIYEGLMNRQTPFKYFSKTNLDILAIKISWINHILKLKPALQIRGVNYELHVIFFLIFQ